MVVNMVAYMEVDMVADRHGGRQGGYMVSDMEVDMMSDRMNK